MAELSALRRRIIEDVSVRTLSPATQRSSISAVSKFSQYFRQSPDNLTLDDVSAFQFHLVSTGIFWAALNQIVCALRFSCEVMLGEAEFPERIPMRGNRAADPIRPMTIPLRKATSRR